MKFSNFCRKNFLAPLDIKIKVLNTCVNASILYSCETWGAGKIKDIETMYRQGIKSALSVRECVNNEIIYLESGQAPLEIRISSSQIKFWQSLMNLQPTHYISKLLVLAEETRYVKYYKSLLHDYENPNNCTNVMKDDFLNTCHTKIRNAAAVDGDSRLGAYLRVNPLLSNPTIDGKLEFQRVCITRYRTGSHNLRVEDRRLPNSKREDRVCVCNTGIQTLQHVLLHCPLLANIRDKYGVVDVENGVKCDAFLLEMECILCITT